MRGIRQVGQLRLKQIGYGAASTGSRDSSSRSRRSSGLHRPVGRELPEKQNQAPHPAEDPRLRPPTQDQ